MPTNMRPQKAASSIHSLYFKDRYERGKRVARQAVHLLISAATGD